MVRPGRRPALVWQVAVWMACLLTACPVALAADYGGFIGPQVVTIEGYSGSAMEPFITPDGRYLLFNSSNVEPNIASLQLATRIDAQTFLYQGELEGATVNEPGVLSGTPTVDRSGSLFFVSPRSYAETLSTIYAAQFSSGQVTDVHLLQGVSGEVPGFVDFDVTVSFGGSALYVSVGDFRGGSGPTSASIRLYDRLGDGFILDPASSTTLHTVNAVAKLDYAPGISSDGLELFFTAANPAIGQAPTIYRAARASPSKPFGPAQRIAAITGFAEAPSISADGTTLYYHELVGSQYRIQSVTRPLPPAPMVTGVAPKKGLASGGSSVRIKGANLAGVTDVRFGAVPAPSFQLKSAGEITAISPTATAGAADVIVTTPAGSSASSSADHFKFVPVVSALSPNSGSTAGGTEVTVNGAGFSPGSGATVFKFGSRDATSVDCPSTTTCTVVSPSHATGTVEVRAAANGVAGAKNAPADQFGYL